MFNNARSKVKHDMPLKDLKRGGFMIKKNSFYYFSTSFSFINTMGTGKHAYKNVIRAIIHFIGFRGANLNTF